MSDSDYYDDYDDEYFEDDEYLARRKRAKRARPPSRSKGGVGAFLILVVILIILLIILASAEARESIKDLWDPQPEFFRSYPEYADFNVRRTITLTPYPPGSTMKYEIEIPIPEDIGDPSDPIQDIQSVNAAPEPDSTPEDNGAFWFVWDREGVTQRQTLTIDYRIHTESANWDIDPSESGTIEDIPEDIQNTYGNREVDEWVIRPTDTTIRDIATDLTADKFNVYTKLKAIYDYMNENYNYVTARKGIPQDCVETYNMKSGDCDDQSVLFASIARAAGLAAWLEFGALYNSDDESWTGHAWLLVYIPMAGDKGGSVNVDIVNQQFLFRDSYRFSEWSSIGNETALKDYYYAQGSNFDYEEKYTTLSSSESDAKIKVGEDGRPAKDIVPGFEAVLLIPTVIALALIIKKRKRFK